MNDEEEFFNEEQFERDEQQKALMFPNANFVIAIDLADLDNIVSDEKTIVIKQTYTCYCYTHHKPTEYYIITGEKITNKYILLKLIEEGLNLDCNHMFIEGFHKYPEDSRCQFEIITGS